MTNLSPRQATEKYIARWTRLDPKLHKMVGGIGNQNILNFPDKLDGNMTIVLFGDSRDNIMIDDIKDVLDLTCFEENASQEVASPGPEINLYQVDCTSKLPGY